MDNPPIQAPDTPFILRERRRSIPGDLRILRRVALVTILLNACRDRRATFQQLHVLNWASRSPEARSTFLSFLNGFLPPDRAVVRYDPALSRAITYALYEGLIQDREPVLLDEQPLQADKPSYRIALSGRGAEFVTQIVEGDYLIDERVFLDSIGKKVTQTMVESLFAQR